MLILTILEKKLIKHYINRLFKAAKRTVRAEVNLIIVIIIITSWSIYALYKLTIGSSDSILGFNVSKTNPDQATLTTNSQIPIKNLSSNNLIHQNGPFLVGNQPFEANQHQQVDYMPSQKTATEQLALYKNQILKELLQRQRELYDDLTKTKQAPFVISDRQQEPIENKLNFDEPKPWRGGFKLLSPIGNSGENKKNLKPPQQKRPSILDKINPIPSQRHGGHLRLLTNAPSLMQLKSAANDRARENHSPESSLKKNFELDANIVETDREPEESAVSTRDYENFNNSHSDSTTDHEQESKESDSTTTEAPAVETTTTTPTTEELSEQQNDDAENKDDAQTDSTNESNNSDDGVNDQSAPENGESDRIDDESMQRVKNAVHSIDEEVDKMTQPSSGMTSRQDKPFDYKNTVQFDDTLGSHSSASQPAKHKAIHPVGHETAIAKIVESKKEKTRTKNDLSGSDLLVDHNQHSISSDFIQEKINSKPAANLGSIGIQEVSDHIRNNKKATSSALSDPKISKIEFGSPIEISSRNKRNKRSMHDDIKPGVLATDEGQQQGEFKRLETNRREDEDDNDDDDNDNSVQTQPKRSRSRGRREFARSQTRPMSPTSDNYHYITSDDPTLQELLAHKELLDALQQSRLPPPIVSSSIQPNISLASPPAKTNPAHQSTDHHYSVDEGLLLYPTSDDEYDHKKMSKKHSKSSNKKSKNKMTVAMKKGGHKKKKHKKEEKKYHKEKKFKGAKKGKKVKKGKGGKGGKKGSKFYKDKGFKKKGFKNIYVKNEFGQKKSYFDEFRDKDFKKKWKNFDDKYNYAQMKKWQAKESKGAKKMKDHGEKFKKYDKSKWKKKYLAEKKSESSKKKKKMDEFS